MDSRTGDLYPTKEAALEAGVPEAAVVEVKGTPEAVAKVAGAVAAELEHERARQAREAKAAERQTRQSQSRQNRRRRHKRQAARRARRRNR